MGTSDFNEKLILAKEEYQRLCSLIGRPPYSDCQLVALMIHLSVPESLIVCGIVHCEDKDVEHFWIRVEGKDIDPLSGDWPESSVIIKRSIVRSLKPSEIIEEYQKFIEEFPDPSPYSFFPLRWKVKKELLALSEAEVLG